MRPEPFIVQDGRGSPSDRRFVWLASAAQSWDVSQLLSWFLGALVKRLTSSRKQWLLRRQKNELRRSRSRAAKGYVPPSRKESPEKAQFLADRRSLPCIEFDYEYLQDHAAFVPPARFSLARNYEATLAFLMDFERMFFERRLHRCPSGEIRKVYADFGRIQEIDAGAGLVLAAEIDRFATMWGKPRGVFDHLWEEPVRDFFTETGLFELLKIDPRGLRVSPSGKPVRRTLKFVAGRSRTGSDAQSLLQKIEALTGRPVRSRPRAYAAIAEALANVSHAYPEGFQSWPPLSSKRWWASGFWIPTGNRVGLQLYDQGAGIPTTLPKQTHYPRILRFLDPEATPAGLIAAALEYGRTSTGQPGRGKGLAEMADWIEYTGEGFLRILSGAGEVTYRPGSRIEKRNLDAPFRGTLVEWEVTLDD